MPDQVPEKEKAERSARLLMLEKEMSKQYRASFLGTETEILLEEAVTIKGKSYMVGHTKEYVKAAVSCDENRVNSGKNTMVTGILKEFLTDDIIYLAENVKLG